MQAKHTASSSSVRTVAVAVAAAAFAPVTNGMTTLIKEASR